MEVRLSQLELNIAFTGVANEYADDVDLIYDDMEQEEVEAFTEMGSHFFLNGINFMIYLLSKQGVDIELIRDDNHTTH